MFFYKVKRDKTFYGFAFCSTDYATHEGTEKELIFDPRRWTKSE